MSDERIRSLNIEILSDNWYVLKKATYEYLNNDGAWENQQREAYDRGNGAVILLYNIPNKNVILTRQFRLPTYLNGNPDGHLIEACAGLLDDNDPGYTIVKETHEETGYRIDEAEKLFEIYMSPGSVTEILHFYIAQYDHDMRVGEGGGADDEKENIEVLELPFEKCLHMITTGEIRDAKTIILLQHLRIRGIL